MVNAFIIGRPRLLGYCVCGSVNCHGGCGGGIVGTGTVVRDS